MNLDGLERVKDLFLHGNLFDGPIPPTLQKMPSLRRLVLSYNKLEGKIPKGPNVNSPSNSCTNCGWPKITTKNCIA